MKNKTYTIKQQNGVQVLMADGAVQCCPFQQATPVQDKFRGLQLVPVACTSQCPHFNLNVPPTFAQVSTVELTCGQIPMHPRIVNDEQEEEKTESKSGIILN